jgi:trans-2,3-dihydro-3-hydroxyanthranilate isomerase
VRIFTPGREIPFAGQPNVGTAFVLAAVGELGPIRSRLTVTFEEQAGLVPITIDQSGGRITSWELAAPQSPASMRNLPSAMQNGMIHWLILP